MFVLSRAIIACALAHSSRQQCANGRKPSAAVAGGLNGDTTSSFGDGLANLYSSDSAYMRAFAQNSRKHKHIVLVVSA